MSIKDATDFLNFLGNNPEACSKVEALTGQNILQQLVTFAAKLGFTFSIEEYRQAVVEAAEGELNEEALAQVLDELGLESR